MTPASTATEARTEHALSFVANEKFGPGLLAALGSVFLTSRLDSFSIYIGHDQDKPIDVIWQSVIHLCRRFHFPSDRCHLVPIDFTGFHSHAKGFFGCHENYGRHYLAQHLREKVCLYLDSDMLVLEDISKLVRLLPENAPCAAVRDSYISTHAADGYLLSPENDSSSDGWGSGRDAPYFNSGLLLVDTEAYREIDVLKRFREIQTRLTNPGFSDQTLCNIVFKDQWTELPGSWNSITTVALPSPLEVDGEMVKNLHFATADKPWLRPHLDAPRLLWYCIAEYLEIELPSSLREDLEAQVVRLYEQDSGWLRIKLAGCLLNPMKKQQAADTRQLLKLHSDLALAGRWLNRHGVTVRSQSISRLLDSIARP